MSVRFYTNTSVYWVDLEGGFWRKNQGGLERLWGFGALPGGAEDGIPDWSEVRDALEERDPVIGERLYVSSRDLWYLSSPIERIEYGEDD